MKRTGVMLFQWTVFPSVLIIGAALAFNSGRIQQGYFGVFSGLSVHVGYARTAIYIDPYLGDGLVSIAWNARVHAVGMNTLPCLLTLFVGLFMIAIGGSQATTILRQINQHRRASSCPLCGYSLAGLHDAIQCPECGAVLPWRTYAAAAQGIQSKPE